MKFFTIVTSAALAAIAASRVVTLKTHIANAEYDQYLSSIHEGAGINYLFAGDGGETYSYDSCNGYIYKEIVSDNLTYNMSLSTNLAGGYPQLKLTVEAPNVKWWVGKDNQLGGSFEQQSIQFYAGLNTGDPYSYSTDRYAIGAYGGDIAQLNLYKVENLQVVNVFVEYVN